MAKTKMTRKVRSDSELQQDSLTVLYEFDALYKTAANLLREDVRKDRVSSNAHIESFGIHCRAIIKFLFGHDDGIQPKFTNRPNDVLAIDYFHDDASKWTGKCPKIELHLCTARDQADKQIAHITIERRGLNQSPDLIVNWEIGKDLRSLSEAMLQFVSQVSETRLAPGVKAELKELVQKALQATDDGAAGSANAPASSSTSKTLGSFQASTQPDKPSVGPLVSITGRTVH